MPPEMREMSLDLGSRLAPYETRRVRGTKGGNGAGSAPAYGNHRGLACGKHVSDRGLCLQGMRWVGSSRLRRVEWPVFISLL